MTSRRGFFAGAMGLGLAGTATAAPTPPGQDRGESSSSPSITRYERILAQTDRLNLLGVPRSWSLVQQGFHPFAPERIAVLPSGSGLRYPGHRRRGQRRRIEERIARYRADLGREPEDFPRQKVESFFWIMDVMTSHYRTPDLFEDWVVGLGERESLMSSALWGQWGLVHQFQNNEAPVDCPPVDWWLFLVPEGLDWASIWNEPVHALIGHVGRCAWAKRPSLMLPVWCLSEALMKGVPDARLVSRMSHVAAAHHLNEIAAECLEGMDSRSRS
jgi:hypothetical protein